MKKVFFIFLFLLMFTNAGWCISIVDTAAGSLNGTDVGSIDTYIDIATLSDNSPTTQTTWVNQVLSSLGYADDTATFQIRDEPVVYFLTDTSNIFAFHMEAPASEFFLIKNSEEVALFANNDELLWGVFGAIPAMNLTAGNFEISHVTRFNPAPVPEPSTLLLLGSGIMGFALYRRKRK